MVSTASPAPGPRVRWQRLGEELELLATCFRLAGDPEDPNAPRRIRSLLETALLLRPLVTRFDEETVVTRLERQLQLAKDWLAWRRQQMLGKETVPDTPGIRGVGAEALEGLQNKLFGEEALLNVLGAGKGASSLSRLLPLFLLLAGQIKTGRTDREGGQESNSPFSGLLQALGSLVRGSPADGLSVLPALLTTLLRAGETKTTAPTPTDPSPAQVQVDTGSLPSNITTLLPQAQKLANDPEAVNNLMRRAEEKLGKDGLQRLQEMARRLAGEMGMEGAG